MQYNVINSAIASGITLISQNKSEGILGYYNASGLFLPESIITKMKNFSTS